MNAGAPAPGDRPPPADEMCLVTGASGFIGGHVTQQLLREGYRVRCLVRTSSDTSRLEQLAVDLVTADLTSPSSLVSVAEGCRFVLHCAALVSDWATTEEIKLANVSGTRNMLNAAVAASVERFVHFSTTDVYGYPGLPEVDESYAAAGFRNWYSETKRAAEAEVRRIATMHPLEVVILRPATVYGPYSEDVVGEMARAVCGRQMLLVDGGWTIAGLSYVENVADGAILAMRSPTARGQAFNLSDGLKTSWRQFLTDLAAGLGCAAPRWSLPYGAAYGVAVGLEHSYRLLRRMTGLSARPLLTRQAVHVLGRDQDFSNRKAREKLRWEPRVSYAAGLEATLAWLHETGVGG